VRQDLPISVRMALDIAYMSQMSAVATRHCRMRLPMRS
jgi:hypothetical protein